MSRNKARLVSMQAIFQLDSGTDRTHYVAEVRSEEEELAERDMAYLNDLIRDVIKNQTAIDEIIVRYSIDWDLNRLGKVDRAILRMAIGEILFIRDVPISVSINEAVRLAKKYGSEHSFKFINGILGKYSREEHKEVVKIDTKSSKPKNRTPGKPSGAPHKPKEQFHPDNVTEMPEGYVHEPVKREPRAKLIIKDNRKKFPKPKLEDTKKEK